MIERERIERAARLYKSNEYAAQALDITPAAFHRLCKHYGIPTPRQRRQQAYQQEQADRAALRALRARQTQPAPLYQKRRTVPEKTLDNPP